MTNEKIKQKMTNSFLYDSFYTSMDVVFFLRRQLDSMFPLF